MLCYLMVFRIKGNTAFQQGTAASVGVLAFESTEEDGFLPEVGGYLEAY